SFQLVRGIANALEAVEDVAVSVDVALDDFPIVRAGVAGRGGFGEHDSLLELTRIDVGRDTVDSVPAQIDRGNAAIEGRTIILDAGGYAERLAFHVHRDVQQMVSVNRLIAPPRERRACRDGQRGRSGNARARRRFAARGQGRGVEPMM